ncbi:MAG: enoyl-CoA hydratase [Actinomycetota bacterium]|jgi:enoyl-CoA hydratase/carnithine racemase
MTDELVLRYDADGVSTITLNRPDKLNALTPAVFVALRAHLDAVASDDSVRCVVLTGAGRSFCAGHDLGAIAEGTEAPSRHFESETVDALEQLPKPTIAKIKGHCFTGGLELALGCDLLIAADTAQLGDTHGQWGLVPVWGMSVRLPERVGRSRAKELMFTSRRISGAEAAAMGLVDRVVPESDLDTSVGALAAEIAGNSAGTNRIDKALLAAQGRQTRDEALLFERTLPFGVPDDMRERMSAPRKK